MQLPLILTIATKAVIGPGAGMSLDQAIKQLPACWSKLCARFPAL